ncbi:MAG TPA: DUF1080 domain-containing protein [Verrucomicrobiae bacterium]|nr:DUF1080 domain-containing protein [Verrucomicrobiae bacterium]
MPRLTIILTCAVVCLVPAVSQKPNPFIGRWDIDVSPTGENSSMYPDWMEVAENNGALTMRIQPQGGGAFAVTDFKIAGSHLSVTWPRRGSNAPAITWDLDVTEGRLSGSERRGDRVAAYLSGVRAPTLDRKQPAAWGDPQAIFNGKDLTGWEPVGMAKNNWIAKEGDLVNLAGGANLRTSRTFNDFKLHVEFNCPPEGNSGIYLRGRYEVQIEYQAVDANDPLHAMGSIYSFVPPTVNLQRKPGTWESFDITLVGRRVTIFRNRIKTIDNQEIPGPTGGALDANEGEAGPFYIQGDHTGGMRFRNITVQLPKR